MKLKIEMLPNSYEEEDGFINCLGRIYIRDDFWETIAPALNYWTINDYERQWKEGLERIKTQDTSCLVASVQNPYTSNRLINWWPLYKDGNKIYIRNQLIVAENYEKLIGDKVFSPETCYDFLRSKRIKATKRYKPSEWVVDLYDVEECLAQS
jgi:hypothetical protein